MSESRARRLPIDVEIGRLRSEVSLDNGELLMVSQGRHTGPNERAGAPDRYRCNFYPGGHKFDRPIRADAFAWFDEHLRPRS